VLVLPTKIGHEGMAWRGCQINTTAQLALVGIQFSNLKCVQCVFRATAPSCSQKSSDPDPGKDGTQMGVLFLLVEFQVYSRQDFAFSPAILPLFHINLYISTERAHFEHCLHVCYANT
jgi:hypothetical protein